MTKVISPDPILQFLKSTGVPLSGGKLFTYAAGTATKKTTYSDSTGNTANTNPVILNSRGEAPVWLTPGGAYKFVLSPSTDTDPPTAPIWTVDNILGSGNAAGQGQTYDTVAQLQAASVGNTVNTVTLNGYTTPGDGGAALYAKSGSAGPGPGLVQSADGAWWILVSVPLNVLQFGADPTGGVSAVTAFNAAIAWANARATSTDGVAIMIPPGKYKIDANLSAITASNVWFVGTRAAVLSISATGSVFTYSGGATYCGIKGGATFTYPNAPASTAILITVSNAGNLTFEGFHVDNLNTLAVLGTDVTHTAHSVVFSDIMGSVYNSGQPTFDFRWGADAHLQDVNVFVAGVGVPAFDRVSAMTTVANTNFLNFTNGGWDTLFLTGGCACNRYDHAVYVDAPGAASVVENLWLDDAIFDYCSSDAIHLNAQVGSGGIFFVSLKDSYIVSWSGNGIFVGGGGLNELHDFGGSHIYMAGLHGISLSGAGTRDIKMIGTTISNPNRLAAGTSAGVRVETVIGFWECIGVTVLNDPSGAFPWSAYNGISVAADNNYFNVTNCQAQGTNKNYDIPTDTTASQSRFVNNNRFSDYSGLQAAGLFVKPASTVNWINKSPFNVTVTASGMDLGLGAGYNGAVADFAPLTGGGWLVPPGGYFFAAYSGASKMQFFVHP